MSTPPCFIRVDDPDETRDAVMEGGEFTPEWLLEAYRCGWFPWPHDAAERLWVSNYERMLIPRGGLHCSRSLRRSMRRGAFRLSFDTAFERVVGACAGAPRSEGDGTWITPALAAGFGQLHAQGLAHSVEVWQGERLVGGLYGLSLGRMMCGESMFHHERDASKVAMVALCAQLDAWEFDFLDCQVHSSHLESMGARVVARPEFLERLDAALTHPDRCGPWRLQPELCELSDLSHLSTGRT